MPSYYPKIDVATVKNLIVLEKLSNEDPEYFKESPYPIEVEEYVKGKKVADKAEEGSASGPLNVLDEIEATYTQLKNHKPDKEDAAATMSYYRTVTSLLDKLLEQIERGKNQKTISEFYSHVLNFLEEICTPSQITSFNEKLKGL